MRKALIKFLMILAGALCRVGPVVAQGWQWQNPLPQGNDLRSMDAVDANHVWFGTSAGVVLHSSDGGASWQLQQTPSHAFILGIDFADTQYGWAIGTAESVGGVLLHTKDGGQTWHRQTPPADLSPLFKMHAIEFLNRNSGWSVGVSGLVLHTRDGGVTWERKSSVRASDGFFRDLNDVSVIDSQRVWVGGNFTLAHTEDGGKSWHTDSTEVGEYDIRQVFFVDPDHGWALTEFGGKLFKTVDGGKNWIPGNGNIDEGLFQVFFVTPDSGWASSSNGVYRTFDGGVHWEKISDQLVGTFVFVDEHAAWSGFEAGTGILRTLDGGHNWASFTKNVTSASLQAVDFVDSETGWVVGSGGTILATQDGGQQWVKQESGVDTRLTDVMFLNKELGWAVGFTGTVLRTQNGGQTWEVLQQIPGRNPNRGIFFVDPLTGWLVGGDVLEPGWIRHTTDGGETWIEQTPATIPRMFDLYFLDKNIGWVVGEEIVLHTKDGGENWRILGTDMGFLRKVDFVDSLHGWIANPDSGIYITEDGGETWTLVSVAGYAPRDVDFIDTNLGWSVGTRGVIFHTQDGGKSWHRQVSLTTRSFSAINFVDANNGWTVGQRGLILHTSTGGVTSVQPVPGPGEPLPTAFQLYPNFPNPFNPETKIRFDIRKPQARVSLTIYDVLGRQVSQLVNDRLPEGSYEVVWDGTNANNIPSPSGVYLGRLQVDGQSQTIKMILLR